MSNFATLSDLVQRVILKLSMYRGTGTQLYAEDRIADMITSKFNQLFEERFWSFNCQWFKYNLGEDGEVYETVSQDIADFVDIYSISTKFNPRYYLKKLNSTTNPFMVEGNTPLYYIRSQKSDKIFRIVPFSSTPDEEVYVFARVRPSNITIDTKIPFDQDALVFAACYEYIIDDGSSSEQAQKFKQLFDERMRILINNENAGTYDQNDEIAYGVTNGWSE